LSPRDGCCEEPGEDVTNDCGVKPERPREELSGVTERSAAREKEAGGIRADDARRKPDGESKKPGEALTTSGEEEEDETESGPEWRGYG
jgi:hypothetical protein